ncbi:MAG: hypothetical protein M1499_06260 [Firmicutes bacterium]|nr:hypothetical protein [Bacillota bacterium]
MLKRRVEAQIVWRTDRAAAYATAPTLEVDLRVTPSTSPNAAEVFHWVNVSISNAKAFLDGTYPAPTALRKVRLSL